MKAETSRDVGLSMGIGGGISIVILATLAAFAYQIGFVPGLVFSCVAAGLCVIPTIAGFIMFLVGLDDLDKPDRDNFGRRY